MKQREIYLELVSQKKVIMSYREFSHKLSATHFKLQANAERLHHEKHNERNQNPSHVQCCCCLQKQAQKYSPDLLINTFLSDNPLASQTIGH